MANLGSIFVVWTMLVNLRLAAGLGDDPHHHHIHVDRALTEAGQIMNHNCDEHIWSVVRSLNLQVTEPKTPEVVIIQSPHNCPAEELGKLKLLFTFPNEVSPVCSLSLTCFNLSGAICDRYHLAFFSSPIFVTNAHFRGNQKETICSGETIVKNLNKDEEFVLELTYPKGPPLSQDIFQCRMIYECPSDQPHTTPEERILEPQTTLSTTNEVRYISSTSTSTTTTTPIKTITNYPASLLTTSVPRVSVKYSSSTTTTSTTTRPRTTSVYYAPTAPTTVVYSTYPPPPKTPITTARTTTYPRTVPSYYDIQETTEVYTATTGHPRSALNEQRTEEYFYEEEYTSSPSTTARPPAITKSQNTVTRPPTAKQYNVIQKTSKSPPPKYQPPFYTTTPEEFITQGPTFTTPLKSNPYPDPRSQDEPKNSPDPYYDQVTEPNTKANPNTKYGPKKKINFIPETFETTTTEPCDPDNDYDLYEDPVIPETQDYYYTDPEAPIPVLKNGKIYKKNSDNTLSPIKTALKWYPNPRPKSSVYYEEVSTSPYQAETDNYQPPIGPAPKRYAPLTGSYAYIDESNFPNREIKDKNPDVGYPFTPRPLSEETINNQSPPRRPIPGRGWLWSRGRNFFPELPLSVCQLCAAQNAGQFPYLFPPQPWTYWPYFYQPPFAGTTPNENFFLRSKGGFSTVPWIIGFKRGSGPGFRRSPCKGHPYWWRKLYSKTRTPNAAYQGRALKK